MLLEYYPEYFKGVQLFLDPVKLDAIMLYGDNVELLSLYSQGGPRMKPTARKFIYHSPEYHKISIMRQHWRELCSIFNGNDNADVVHVLTDLIQNLKPGPKYVKQTDDFHQRLEVMLL